MPKVLNYALSEQHRNITRTLAPETKQQVKIEVTSVEFSEVRLKPEHIYYPANSYLMTYMLMAYTLKLISSYGEKYGCMTQLTIFF